MNNKDIDHKVFERVNNFFYTSKIEKSWSSDESEEVFDFLIRESPGSNVTVPHYYHFLLNKGEISKAFGVAAFGVIRNPSLEGFFLEAYRELKNRDIEEIENIYVETLTNFEELYGRKLSGHGRENYIEWALADVDEIIEKLVEQQIPYVLLNYPPMASGRESGISRAIKTHAEKMNYHFLDTYSYLNIHFEKNKELSRHDYYAYGDGSDNHLNRKGYELVADQLVDYIETAFFTK